MFRALRAENIGVNVLYIPGACTPITSAWLPARRLARGGAWADAFRSSGDDGRGCRRRRPAARLRKVLGHYRR
jgi:hypothetical protein